MTVGIIFFLFVSVYIKYENLNEKREIERAADIFETTVYKYTAKSLASKKTFEIKFDYLKKEIRIKPEGKNILIEKIDLPKKLKYATVKKGNIEKEKEFLTKKTGNISKAFSVYICDYSENAKYRIAYYTFQQSRILKINVYKNVRAGKIKYEDLGEYHYNLGENEVKEGWEKQ